MGRQGMHIFTEHRVQYRYSILHNRLPWFVFEKAGNLMVGSSVVSHNYKLSWFVFEVLQKDMSHTVSSVGTVVLYNKLPCMVCVGTT